MPGLHLPPGPPKAFPKPSAPQSVQQQSTTVSVIITSSGLRLPGGPKSFPVPPPPPQTAQSQRTTPSPATGSDRNTPVTTPEEEEASTKKETPKWKWACSFKGTQYEKKCDGLFASADALRTHVRNVHNLIPHGDTDKVNRDGTPKFSKCKFCERWFQTKPDFANHQRVQCVERDRRAWVPALTGREPGDQVASIFGLERLGKPSWEVKHPYNDAARVIRAVEEAAVPEGRTRKRPIDLTSDEKGEEVDERPAKRQKSLAAAEVMAERVVVREPVESWETMTGEELDGYLEKYLDENGRLMVVER